jgi:L-iditol 2-dehydrogenase
VVSETAAVLPSDSAFLRQGLYNLEPSGWALGMALTALWRPSLRCRLAVCIRSRPRCLWKKASLTEPCCVAYNAVCVHSRIRPGDTVAVIGPGPKRLAIARQIGADTVLGAQGEDVTEWVRNLGDGYGLDLVIDAAGVSASLKLALDIVRPAGQITKVGWGPKPLNFSLDQLVQKAATLQGSFSHNWPIWDKVISLLATGKIDLDPILNRISPLAEWHEAFEQMHSGIIVKGVLRP